MGTNRKQQLPGPQLAWGTKRHLAAPLSPTCYPGEDASEVEVLRQLEDDILASAGSLDGAASPDRDRNEKHWRNRIMAVAAFRAAGARRHAFEDEILALGESASRNSTEKGMVTHPGGGHPEGHVRPFDVGQEHSGREPDGHKLSGARACFTHAHAHDQAHDHTTPHDSCPGTMSPRAGGLHSLTACSSFKSMGFLSLEDEDEMDSIVGTVNGQSPVQPLRAVSAGSVGSGL